MGLSNPGLRVWVEPASNPKRKLQYSWRLVELEGAWAGIDTSVPNRVVGEALAARRLPGTEAYGTIRPEQRYAASSRIDFLATEPGLPDAYLEVKNVHLVRKPGLAEFPDSVTTRGAKHLGDLTEMVAAGHRAVMIYCVQHTAAERLAFAEDLDPGYVTAYRAARAAGVEAMAMVCTVSPAGIALDRTIPIAE